MIDFDDIPKLNFRIKIIPHKCNNFSWMIINLRAHNAYCFHLHCNLCRKTIGQLVVYNKIIDYLDAQKLLLKKCGADNIL